MHAMKARRRVEITAPPILRRWMEAIGRPQTLAALPRVKNPPYQVSWFERFEGENNFPTHVGNQTSGPHSVRILVTVSFTAYWLLHHQV
jgi:hypothetical protein